MTLKLVDCTDFSEKRIPSGAEGLEAFEITGGEFKDVVIGEGEMFLLPGMRNS